MGSSGQGDPCSSQLGDLEHLGQGSGCLEGSRTRGHWASLKKRVGWAEKGRKQPTWRPELGGQGTLPKVGTGRKHNSPPTLGCGHSLQWCPCVVEEVALKVEWEGQDSLRPPPFSSPAPQGLGFPLKAHQCCTPHYILPFLHLGPLLRALTSVFCSPPPYSAA